MFQDNISIKYIKTDPVGLPAVVGLTEDDIRKELSKCFDTSTRIMEIHFSIELDRSMEDGKYISKINIVSPDIDFYTERSGNDYPKVVHEVIHLAIRAVHEQAKTMTENKRQAGESLKNLDSDE